VKKYSLSDIKNRLVQFTGYFINKSVAIQQNRMRWDRRFISYLEFISSYIIYMLC